MEGNRELEQLDAEARALKATLMRYMSEALIEDQGLNKLTAELTKIVQASQRHSADSATRAEQKLQVLAAAVEALRTQVHQSHEQLLRELGKRKKTLDTETLTEQLDRLQLEVRNLARAVQVKEARAGGTAVALDIHETPTYKPQRAARSRLSASPKLGPWRFAAPLAVLLAASVGYNVWQATRSVEPKAHAAARTPSKVEAQVAESKAAVPAPPVSAPPPVEAAPVPNVKQAAWDNIWKAALELPLQQCWPEAKSNAKVSKFRDCACPKVDKDNCEWTAKWAADASAAALQAVLSVAAAKPITIDAKVGAGTFSAIDLVVRDCGFKDATLTQAIEALRTTRGKAPSDGREPATHQILDFMKKNLHSCR